MFLTEKKNESVEHLVQPQGRNWIPLIQMPLDHQNLPLSDPGTT